MPKTNKLKGKRLKKARTSEKAKFEIKNAIEEFMVNRKAERRSPKTLNKDRFNLDIFIQYLELKSAINDVRLITTELIRDYILWMLHEKVKFEGHKYKTEAEKTVGLAPTTVNTRLQTLKVFFRFVHGKGLVKSKDIKNVQEDEQDICVLSKSEMKRLFDVPNQRSYAEFRDYVLMNLLLDSLVRINEALTLRKEDVNFVENTITIRGSVAKNRRSRILPIQSRTAKLIKELIKEVEEFDSEYIFLANYGDLLTANHFRNRLRMYSKKAGLGITVHPHLFRHTGATDVRLNSGHKK